MAVAVKATATHLRQVQRVRRNLRERRERLKRQGLRRGERHADGSEHGKRERKGDAKQWHGQNSRCLIGSVRGEKRNETLMSDCDSKTAS